jgi:hypothetical protein
MPGTTSACVAWAFLSISSERRGTAITDPQALGYALLHTAGDRRPVVNRVEKVLRIARQRIVDVEVEKVAMRAGGYEPGQRALAGCKPAASRVPARGMLLAKNGGMTRTTGTFGTLAMKPASCSIAGNCVWATAAVSAGSFGGGAGRNSPWPSSS